MESVRDRRCTYIYFQILVKLIVHNECMCKPYPVRLHGMASRVGIVANILVVTVGYRLLLAFCADQWAIDRRKAICHDEAGRKEKSWMK